MKLLIVEDEADLRKTLGQALREEGYVVDLAKDGTEGRHKAENWDYDAILLDLMLPGMDGWEVLRRLREKKKTPVLLLTARDTLQDRVRGLDLGSDDYVVKPFDMMEIFARLRAIIRRSTGGARSIIRIGPLVVDAVGKTVSAHGNPVDVTTLEYSLLEFMARHRGRVVSRAELYDHLFSEQDDSFSNALDVHICNVRKKIGPGIIRTRRGQGYVLEAA